jgi:hypothetical protein
VTVVDRPLGRTASLPLPERLYPEPAVGRPPGRRRRNGQKVGAAVALILVGAWMISSFWVSVQVRSPRQPFAAPTAGQSWVSSPEAGSRAFFRLRLPIYGTLPQTVTLWVQGFQQVTGYVNGFDVAPTLVAPDKLIDTAVDLPKMVETIDLRPSLSIGLNVVGLEVVSFDGRSPAFQARVEVRNGGLVQTYGVSPSSWQSTTNAALTGQELPQSGAFSKPRLDDGSWVPAVGSATEPGQTTVSVPPDAFTTPATAPALIGAYGARSVVASTVVTFPHGCSEGWLRAAATGSYTISLDGRAIGVGGAGSNSSSLPLTVFDLCPVATPGRHVLAISVSASREPVAYLDGYVRSGSDTVSFATGPGWIKGTSGSGGASGDVVGTLNSPQTELGMVFATSMGTVTIPSGPLLAEHLKLAVELLALALLAVLIACACGVALAGAITAVLCGVLPAIGLCLLLTETRHLVYVQAPFPSTPAMLDLVLGLAVAGVVVAMVFAVRARPPRAAAATRRPPGANGAPTTMESGWIRRHWYQLCVGVTGVGWALVQSYHVMFNPLWQDELSSLAAAQGMRAHLLPEWPSGFLYWKSELYTALIAVVGGLTHDNPSVLKDVSVFWFGVTILLFGLVLMPMVLRGRKVYQLAATVVFATAPFELGHAQDIRMYQMVQCIVVLVSILLLRAINDPTTKRVAWLMVAVVAMYLTHEESFGVLFIIPLALCCFEGLRWTRNWRWWVFGGAAVGAISVQLALATFTHPPIFGVDPSGGPLVAWSPTPFYYLANYFFTNPTYGASITIVSSLAVVGIVVGVKRRDPVRLYLAAFWVVPTTVVSVGLLTKDTRYAFICLPFVFALGACGTIDIIDGVRRVVLRGVPRGNRLVRKVFIEVMAGLALVAIMLSLIGGLNDYGTWTGAVFNANIAHRWLDYPTAVDYVKARLEPGDAIIAAATPNLVGYSLGRPPTYWIPPHRTETLLYVFEKHDQVVDTQYGIPTILNANDLEDALAAHRRVWLIGPDSVIRSLIPTMRTIVEKQFTLQEDGEFVSVFLATSR